MKAVIQRVLSAQVEVDQKKIAEIGSGLVTFLGVQRGDHQSDLDRLMTKIFKLRVFEDDGGKMNRSLLDEGKAHLIVSQFTLLGSCQKGNRPSFFDAELPDRAKKWIDLAVVQSQLAGIQTQSGQFGADMRVSLVNDGPVTLILDSKQL